MNKLKAILGYTAGGFTIAFAVLTPFFLFNLFTDAIARTGLQVDPMYIGGDPARTLERTGYQIVIHQPVSSRALLPQSGPFIQLTWKPASALPARVSEEIDIDNDNRPDLTISFEVPKDPEAKLQVDVVPMIARLQAMHRISLESFSSLIARVGDSIIVRIPFRPAEK